MHAHSLDLDEARTLRVMQTLAVLAPVHVLRARQQLQRQRAARQSRRPA
jgi:hypothetical protein